MKYNNILKLASSIIICELAGVVGSFFALSQIQALSSQWYNSLAKPSFSPPNWIFGPVWTTLFILMGISLYLVWSEKFVIKNEIDFKGRRAWNPWSQKFLSGKWQEANIIIIFAIQLILNVLWPIIFFVAHSAGAAFFELLMLWFAIIYTIINFYRVSKTAALLLMPYILWVSFAGILNYFIWIINI